MIPSFKKLWILVLFVLAGYSSKAQIKDSAHVRNHYTNIERQFSMHNGVKLFTAIYIRNSNNQHSLLTISILKP